MQQSGVIVDAATPGTIITYLNLTFIMLIHLVCLAFTCLLIFLAQPGMNLFSWHPTLMVIAFSLLMVESILVFSPRGSLFSGITRGTKFQLHWLGMTIALVCALVGGTCIWLNKEQRGKTHYTTWHGIIGVTTIGYATMQCIAGVFARYPSLVPRALRPPSLRAYHAASGVALMSFACVSVVLGLYSNWFRSHIAGVAWYACMACPVLMTVAVARQVNSAYFSRRSTN